MRSLFILLFGSIILLGSCEIKQEVVQGDLHIVCTTSIIGDMVKKTVGNRSEVNILMGPGVDPHEYTPTKKDLDALSNANVIIVHGLELEGKMTDVFEKLERQGKKIIRVTDGIDKSNLLAMSGNHSGHNHKSFYDPHCWNAPLLWINAISYTSGQLADLDTVNRQLYLKNSRKHQEEIKLFHEKFKEKFNAIEGEKYLVTAHDAFAYLGRSYGFNVESLQGASTAAEFGIKDKIKLVNFIVENNVKYVFTESSVPDKNMKSLIEDCASRGHNVTLGGQLYSDALGPVNSKAGSYLGMMEYNLETILNAIK